MPPDRSTSGRDARPRPLVGIRVLDLADEFGAYAGRLLADLGAEVLRVSPPTGGRAASRPETGAAADPQADAFGWFVGLGKRVVALDLDAPDDRPRIEALLDTADVLLESLGPDARRNPGWGRDELETRYPRLIQVSVTPFGLDGPRAGDAGTDLVALASGGLLSLGGYPDTPPIRPNSGQAALASGIFGAVAAIFGLIARDSDGRARQLDVSAEEAIASALEDAIPTVDLTGRVRRRAGDAPREAGTGIYRCADGYVSMVAGRLGTARAWRSLVDWLVEEQVEGAEQLLAEPWQSFPYRQRREAVAAFSAVFSRFAASRTKADLYTQAQARSIALAPVNEVSDVLADPQLAARGFFVPLPAPAGASVPGGTLQVPGRPYRLSEDGPFEPQFATPGERFEGAGRRTDQPSVAERSGVAVTVPAFGRPAPG